MRSRRMLLRHLNHPKSFSLKLCSRDLLNLSLSLFQSCLCKRNCSLKLANLNMLNLSPCSRNRNLFKLRARNRNRKYHSLSFLNQCRKLQEHGPSHLQYLGCLHKCRYHRRSLSLNRLLLCRSRRLLCHRRLLPQFQLVSPSFISTSSIVLPPMLSHFVSTRNDLHSSTRRSSSSSSSSFTEGGTAIARAMANCRQMPSTVYLLSTSSAACSSCASLEISPRPSASATPPGPEMRGMGGFCCENLILDALIFNFVWDFEEWRGFVSYLGSVRFGGKVM